LNRYAHDKPVQLLGAAAALGAALVVVRPWRLVSITSLLLATLKSSGLTTTLLSLLSAQSELNDSPERPAKTI
jgi:membrane-associated PAP2 superfamily phosphatase